MIDDDEDDYELEEYRPLLDYEDDEETEPKRYPDKPVVKKKNKLIKQKPVRYPKKHILR